MPRPCTSHGWNHATEPCPYCRETRPESSDSEPTSNRDRAERLTQAIVASLSGDATQVEDLFTQDVVGSGPAIAVASREELAVEIEDRMGTFTDVEVACAPLDVAGAKAVVEWVASAVHTGPLVLDASGAGIVAPSGKRVRVRAITVAEFEGNRISAFRSYWDDLPTLQVLDNAQAR